MFNIFKKNKSKDIVNPLDNININDYKDLDLKEKELVDNLIDEYKMLFKENNSIIDIDKDIYNNFKMYQELIINIISNLDTNNTLDSIISLLKLKVYFDELTNIYDNLKTKLIALKQIKNNKEYLRIETLKYYLGKRKINIDSSLSNLINNISLSIVNTYTLINIVNKEIINLSGIAININLDDYKKEINNKLYITNTDYTLLFNNSLNIDNNLTKLILEEIELEKFTYLNKDKKQELLNKLDEISNTEIQSKEEQKEIINNLIKIKTYFNIFNKYGKNIINEEELNNLYKIIFNAFTYFTYDCNEFILYYNNTFKNEYEYYNKIIDFKKEMLIQGKSPAFNNIDNSDKEDIINLLNDYGIRKNIPTPLRPHVLSLILSLEEENGLEDFFKYNTINEIQKKNLSTTISSPSLRSYLPVLRSILKNDNISLYNYYKLVLGLFENINLKSMDEYSLSPLYTIFKIVFKNKIDFNMIPDGIIDFKTEMFERYLNKCDNSRPIILPDTVKKINLRNEAFHYILPKEVDEVYIQSSECSLILPYKINKSFVNLNKISTSNFIHRHQILYMDNKDLKKYFLSIYYSDLMKLSENNINEMKSSYIKLNETLNTIKIHNDNGNIESIHIDYSSIAYLWEENCYFLHRIIAIVDCIINELITYRNYLYIIKKLDNIDKKNQIKIV